MNDFDDNEYARMIGDLLHDTKYIEISNRGRLSGLRQHSEVLVRKILNIGSESRLMLGQIRNNSNNLAVKKGLAHLDDDLEDKLIEIVNRINPLGIDGVHTSHTDDFSDKEVEGVEDAFLELYALIFIKYFLDIHISLYSPPQVLNEFSFLPPIIRYKTWSYLNEKETNNIQVVNRLCLAIIKTFDKEHAYKWIEDNREVIRNIPYPTKSEIIKYNQVAGDEVEPGKYLVSLCFDRYDNVYDLLYDKIKSTKTSVNEAGKMYKNFEEAIIYFNDYKKRKESNNSEEIELFHSLMEFVFIGIKSIV